MNVWRVTTPLVALIPAITPLASGASAQQWAVDVYLGGARSAALADVGSSNLVGNLRVSGGAGSAYLSAAAPFGTDAGSWAAGGAAAQLTRGDQYGLRFGVRVGLDGYGYRDSSLDQQGAGLVARGTPFLAWSGHKAVFEIRAGARGHGYRAGDDDGSRGVVEFGARLTTMLGALSAIAETLHVQASEAGYPYVGVQLVADHGAGRLWASGGRWLAHDLDDESWGAGASIDLSRRFEVWGAFRREGSDPLFLNEPRETWNVGASMRLGFLAPRPTPELTPRRVGSVVRFVLPFGLVPDTGGGAAPSVAGDFNDWRPVRMTRSEDGWRLDLPLGPGVYRFSFVSPSGEWFVPESFPGRIADGLGGFNAVVVVR